MTACNDWTAGFTLLANLSISFSLYLSLLMHAHLVDISTYSISLLNSCPSPSTNPPTSTQGSVNRRDSSPNNYSATNRSQKRLSAIPASKIRLRQTFERKVREGERASRPAEQQANSNSNNSMGLLESAEQGTCSRNTQYRRGGGGSSCMIQRSWNPIGYHPKPPPRGKPDINMWCLSVTGYIYVPACVRTYSRHNETPHYTYSNYVPTQGTQHLGAIDSKLTSESIFGNQTWLTIHNNLCLYRVPWESWCCIQP